MAHQGAFHTKLGWKRKLSQKQFKKITQENNRWLWIGLAGQQDAIGAQRAGQFSFLLFRFFHFLYSLKITAAAAPYRPPLTHDGTENTSTVVS